jgi:hypothetical protein
MNSSYRLGTRTSKADFAVTRAPFVDWSGAKLIIIKWSVPPSNMARLSVTLILPPTSKFLPARLRIECSQFPRFFALTNITYPLARGSLWS